MDVITNPFSLIIAPKTSKTSTAVAAPVTTDTTSSVVTASVTETESTTQIAPLKAAKIHLENAIAEQKLALEAYGKALGEQQNSYDLFSTSADDAQKKLVAANEAVEAAKAVFANLTSDPILDQVTTPTNNNATTERSYVKSDDLIETERNYIELVDDEDDANLGITNERSSTFFRSMTMPLLDPDNSNQQQVDDSNEFGAFRYAMPLDSNHSVNPSFDTLPSLEEAERTLKPAKERYNYAVKVELDALETASSSGTVLESPLADEAQFAYKEADKLLDQVKAQSITNKQEAFKLSLNKVAENAPFGEQVYQANMAITSALAKKQQAEELLEKAEGNDLIQAKLALQEADESLETARANEERIVNPVKRTHEEPSILFFEQILENNFGDIPVTYIPVKTKTEEEIKKELDAARFAQLFV